MFRLFRRYNKIIDCISDSIANCACYLIFFLTFLVSFEVGMRYLFNHPTTWTTELVQFSFLSIVTLGGAYVMRSNAHVNVDIFQNMMSPRVKAIINLITYLLIFVFLIVVISKNWEVAVRSFKWHERSPTAFAPILWPFKFLIPIGAFLLLLQTLATYFRNIMQAITGIADKQLVENWEDEE